MMYWPDGMKVQPIVEWPGALTKNRDSSNFSSTLGSTMDTLRRELNALRAKDVLLQIAIPREKFRQDGFPYASAKPEHPGIILTLESAFGPLSYPCDTYSTWQENLRAIALALEALRKVDRYGVTKRGEQYRGFLALEAPSSQVVGFADAAEAQAFICSVIGNPLPTTVGTDWPAFIRIAKRKAHPDTGGDAEMFQRVTLAEAKLREEGWL